jgi:hypothetical protein
MYRCSQIVKQFVCADFRTLTWKFVCFAFGYMAACPNTKKIPRRLVAITLSNVFASSLNKTVTASEPNLGAQLAQKRLQMTSPGANNSISGTSRWNSLPAAAKAYR